MQKHGHSCATDCLQHVAWNAGSVSVSGTVRYRPYVPYAKWDAPRQLGRGGGGAATMPGVCNGGRRESCQQQG